MMLQQAAAGIRRDTALALRTLRRSPGFTVAAVAILALGIGMSTAMFTIYRAVLVERLPVTDQARLLIMHPLDRGGAHLDVPMPYLKEMKRDTSVIRDEAGVYHLGSIPVPLLDGDHTFTLSDAIVTSNFFDVLGTRPILGRTFRETDRPVGAPTAVVLSYAAWRQVFNQDPLVVGRTFFTPYAHERVTVVGVAPPGFEYPTGVGMWAAAHDDFLAQMDIVARLASGATIAAARANLSAHIARLNPFVLEEPRTPLAISGVEAHALSQEVLGSSRATIVVLTLAVVLLLVIACVNAGSLVLVRMTGRTREIAVRRAIGASFGAILQQFLIENALIGLAGGAAGLVAAQLLLRVLLALAPSELPRTDMIRIGGAPIAEAVLLTVAAVMLFGLVPSVMAAGSAPYGALREDGRSGSESVTRRRARRWLVSSQIALALIMLAGAALLARSLDHLQHIDLGYQTEHVSMVSVTGPKSFFVPERMNDVVEALTRRIRGVPGVVAATPIESEPFKGTTFYIMKIARADQPPSERATSPFIPFDFAGEDYFRTFEIPILRGRGFLPTEIADARPVVVLSESLARRFWPNEDPIGKQLVNVYDSTSTPRTVIGVVRDTHFRTLRETAPVIYVPYTLVHGFSGYFAVRTRGTLEASLPAIRRALSEENRGVIVWKTTTMDALLAGPLARPRLAALILMSFSLAALVLAAIGLYGVTAALVRHQTRDIGVRMALGATPRDVRRLVLSDAMRVVGRGAAVGLVGALLSTRLLASLLFGVTPLDPLSFGAACAILIAISAWAALVPAHRATRIDPAEALRAE